MEVIYLWRGHGDGQQVGQVWEFRSKKRAGVLSGEFVDPSQGLVFRVSKVEEFAVDREVGHFSQALDQGPPVAAVQGGGLDFPVLGPINAVPFLPLVDRYGGQSLQVASDDCLLLAIELCCHDAGGRAIHIGRIHIGPKQ